MVGAAAQQRHEAQVETVLREWGVIRTVLLAVLGVLIVSPCARPGGWAFVIAFFLLAPILSEQLGGAPDAVRGA